MVVPPSRPAVAAALSDSLPREPGLGRTRRMASGEADIGGDRAHTMPFPSGRLRGPFRFDLLDFPVCLSLEPHVNHGSRVSRHAACPLAAPPSQKAPAGAWHRP